jgi:hypothetical protein
MTSSTSHSRFPKLALLLLVASFLVMGASVAYTMRYNAEIGFLTGAATIKQAWAAKLSAERGHKVVVYGGSGCGFSVDGRRMLAEHGIPLVNYGLHAGIGATVLTRNAMSAVNDGDTLVVSLEPNLLDESPIPPALGIQFAFARGHAEWVTHGEPLSENLSWPSAVLTLRPGSNHALTMIGKWLQGRPLYRYSIGDINESGWMQTAVRASQLPERAFAKGPSESGKRLLIGLRQWCDKHHVRVAYSAPWNYVAPEKVPEFQQASRRFLAAVIEIMPVLRDESLGAHSVREDFADTELHLTAAGSAARTDSLAAQLRNWSLWQPSEL